MAREITGIKSTGLVLGASNIVLTINGGIVMTDLNFCFVAFSGTIKASTSVAVAARLISAQPGHSMDKSVSKIDGGRRRQSATGPEPDKPKIFMSGVRRLGPITVMLCIRTSSWK